MYTFFMVIHKYIYLAVAASELVAPVETRIHQHARVIAI